ncbi:MAG: hypothetical protein WDO16_12105 [Bacteroidota bacterium]
MSRQFFNQVLESNARDLGDVVILSQRRADNGMISISEKNLTTAQTRISAKDLEEMQAASIDQALQGRISGVDITAASGDPGAGDADPYTRYLFYQWLCQSVDRRGWNAV